MRLVITLPSSPDSEEQDDSSSVVVKLVSERPKSPQPRRDNDSRKNRVGPLEDMQAERGRVVAIFLGGPQDEQVRRDIAEGEHIVEDPGFKSIGFYGLVGTDRGGVPVVQWYRWISSEVAEGLG